jgi:hypothetical protein
MRMTFHMLAGYPVPPLITIQNAAPGVIVPCPHRLQPLSRGNPLSNH